MCYFLNYSLRRRVDNNWVSFGGFLWRIIRTTSEGGVKLAYSGNGSSDDSAFINSASYYTSDSYEKYYVGYTYNTSSYTGTQTNSTIKTLVDNWYNSNLSSFASYISETAVHCNDRSSEIGTSTIYYPVYDRIITNSRPTYACLSTNASRYTVSTGTGNGYLTYPIALLTADELFFAGVLYAAGDKSLNSYIMDNAILNGWWTISPYSFIQTSFQVNMWVVRSSGFLASTGMDNVFESLSTRPTISLKPCVKATNGNGSNTNPYTLSDSAC